MLKYLVNFQASYLKDKFYIITFQTLYKKETTQYTLYYIFLFLFFMF